MREVSRSFNKRRVAGLVHIPALAVFLSCLVVACAREAAGSGAQVTLAVGAADRIEVKLKLAQPLRSFHFRDSYAGLSGLAGRIREVVAFSAAGSAIRCGRLASAHFECNDDVLQLTYWVDSRPPAVVGNAANLSWATETFCVLMLIDLLPSEMTEAVGAGAATISVVLPVGWQFAANEAEKRNGTFETRHADRSLIVAGRDLRVRRARAGSAELEVVLSGTWPFAEEDAARLAQSILKEHARVFGGGPSKRVSVVIAPFPRAVPPQRWSAETRGGTVFALLGGYPSKVASLGQLALILSHETFHLWFPEGVRLAGSYDWFYEGFALYQSMLVSIRLGYLTFQEFLAAMSRAVTAYLNLAAHTRKSLLQLSRERWSASQGAIYDHGLMVAFIYDLKLRGHSANKNSIDTVFRRLYEQAIKSTSGVDGSEAVLSAMANGGEVAEFAKRAVTEPSTLAVAEEVAVCGLTLESTGAAKRLVISKNLTRSQKEILAAFGYNDARQPRSAGGRSSN